MMQLDTKDKNSFSQLPDDLQLTWTSTYNTEYSPVKRQEKLTELLPNNYTGQTWIDFFSIIRRLTTQLNNNLQHEV